MKKLEQPKVESLHLLFKAKCLEERFLINARAQSETPDKLERLSLRMTAQLKHIYDVLAAERRFDELRAVQIACLQTNLDAINAFEFKYVGKDPYTQFKKILGEFITAYSRNLKSSKYYGGMLPTVHKSDWLERSRYKLLMDSLDQLLFSERDDMDSLLVSITNDTLPSYQNTYKLIDQLLMGECGGHFSPPQETFVSSYLDVYFADLWRFFINAVKIRPFGRELHQHYDPLFYRYCRLLSLENDQLTTNLVAALIQLEQAQEVVDVLEREDFYDEVHQQPPRPPYLRLIAAFQQLDLVLKDLPLLVTQRSLKQELRKVACQFGFEELVPYDAEQLKIIEMEEKIAREVSNAHHPSPYKTIHKSLVALVETESQWVDKLFVFLNGEADAEGSLRKLLRQTRAKPLLDIQLLQIGILERFYLGMLRVLSTLEQRLAACVQQQAEEPHQVAVLCSLFIDHENETFDTYMVHMVVASLFMDKFMRLIREILPRGSNTQGFLHFEGNLMRACQHLFKLLEAIDRIKSIVPKDGAYQEDVAKIELLHARVKYFVDMADVMKQFFEKTPYVEPEPDEKLLKRLQEEPRLFQQRRLRSAFRAMCALWMHAWDAGNLNINRVIEQVKETVDQPRPEERAMASQPN